MKVKSTKELLISTLFSGIFLFSPVAKVTPVVDSIDSATRTEPLTAIATPEHQTTELATSYATNSYTTYTPVATVAASTPVSTNSANYVNLNGYIIDIWSQAGYYDCNTSYVPASGAALCNGTFLYGHNYTNSLGQFNVANVSTFTMTLNGQTTTYRVSKTIVMTKGAISQGRYMNAFVKGLDRDAGLSHSLVIMTCGPGVVDGSSDDSTRTIVFADAI